MEVLRGRVTSGVGSLSQWMVRFEDLCRAKTGWTAPGRPQTGIGRALVRRLDRYPDRIPEHPVPLSIVPRTIAGIDAFIIGTDKNDRDEGDHARNIIDVRAGVRLRDALAVEDGDVVEVIVTVESDRG